MSSEAIRRLGKANTHKYSLIISSMWHIINDNEIQQHTAEIQYQEVCLEWYIVGTTSV